MYYRPYMVFQGQLFHFPSFLLSFKKTKTLILVLLCLLLLLLHLLVLFLLISSFSLLLLLVGCSDLLCLAIAWI